MLNGINVAGLSEFVQEIRDDSEEATIDYGVSLKWENGTRTEVETLPMTLGHHRVTRSFSFPIDEPRQIGGLNQGPTPQEYILGGLAGCMAVGYVVGASAMGISLETLEIDVAGSLDLRGFLRLDDDAPVGFEDVKYTVRIAGDGTEEQYRYLHEQVCRRSPNRATFACEVKLDAELEILETAGV